MGSLLLWALPILVPRVDLRAKDKMRCYWECLWELGEHCVNLMGTSCELANEIEYSPNNTYIHTPKDVSHINT